MLVLVPVVGVVMVLETVVPNPDVEVAGRVVTGVVAVGVPVLVLVPVPVPVLVPVEVVPVLAALGPILNVPVVANTFEMFPMSTASNVYPAPTGTTGSWRVI